MSREKNIHTVNILGIAGSLRQGSYNKAALRAAKMLSPAGVEIDIFELDDIPPFNQDRELAPPARAAELKAKVKSADAVLFVTPEYNYSVPGVLKNAIDWGARPYGDNSWVRKPAAIMGASTGRLGTARAQYHLRQILQGVNMYVLSRPEVMIADAATKFDPEGNLKDNKTNELVAKLVGSLAQWARRLGKDDE